MRALLAQHNLAESAELPDHLSHALALFGRMSDDEAAAFARESLKPALAQMRTPLAAAQNPHDHLLAAVEAVLQAWCTQPIVVPTP
jgi:nitrate reductase assembly molybdenum cofactor insertion protein NarJ